MNLKQYLPRWLGGSRLLADEMEQARILGMALAALKASEANALIAMQMAQQLKNLKQVVAKLQEPSGILAMYSFVANQSNDFLRTQAAGSLEYEAALLMTHELQTLAKTLQERNDGKRNENK